MKDFTNWKEIAIIDHKVIVQTGTKTSFRCLNKGNVDEVSSCNM